MLKEKQKKGFTLIEIMIVVLIIILLTSFVVFAVDTARKRTRDAIIISSVEQVQALAKTVYNPKNGYKDLKNHENVEELKKRVEEMGMGRRFLLLFPDDKKDINVQYIDDFSEFCAYVQLFRNEEQFFCVDYLGNARIVGGNGVFGDEIINCSHRSINSPSDCEDRI
jgi:prepilin-type N-terminal cleavage/methylation domain-containing protein